MVAQNADCRALEARHAFGGPRRELHRAATGSVQAA